MRKAETSISHTVSIDNQHMTGKALRQNIPRESHAGFTPAADRPDVVELLQAGDAGRIQSLLPIKYGRMIASPFAFFRGSAGLMAYDLASTPTTNVIVQLCGDAHISNFGVFASPERHLVFDINDFDETYRGSWEWDLKRLCASIVIAGQENGFSDRICRELVMTAVGMYQSVMKLASKSNVLDVWYYYINTDQVVKLLARRTSRKRVNRTEKVLKKARGRTHQRSLEKLTEVVDGTRRLRNTPPLLVPFSETENWTEVERASSAYWDNYKDSLSTQNRDLLERFMMISGGLRVGGVGSVGTRCYVVVLQGRDVEDCIVLQQKEAGVSCLEPYFPKYEYANEADRVIRGQRAIQATPDIFLGWNHSREDANRYYYWRQLADMKGSADVSQFDYAAFKGYVSICGACLARAHARTGDALVISDYIGGSDALADALADFSVAYAAQNERDYATLVKAVREGRVAAQEGI